MKRTIKKLALRAETVRELTAAQLRAPRGALGNTGNGDTNSPTVTDEMGRCCPPPPSMDERPFCKTGPVE